MERGAKVGVVNGGRTVGYHTKVFSARTEKTRLKEMPRPNQQFQLQRYQNQGWLAIDHPIKGLA